jgi:folate-binding protein YgfZ
MDTLTGKALHDRSYRELLTCTGEDHVAFLQGMLTQDVKAMSPGSSRSTAVLTAKGAMVADARVLRFEDHIWLDCEAGIGTKLLEFLNRFLISEDAELSDLSAQWSCLSVFGDPELVPKEETFTQREISGVQAVVLPVWGVGVPGVDVWVPREGKDAVWNHFLREGHVPVGVDALEVLRVENGIPRYGPDLSEDVLPLEANLTHAISYTKGCYIGQEVIARATHRGQVNWKLRGLWLPDGELAQKTELFTGARKQATVASCVFSERFDRWLALGFVHRDSDSEGTVLTTKTGARGVVTGLPFKLP